MSSAAIWHDVECGSYAADLPLWEELAAAAGGPVLELGCGTGRVSLHLARRGHEVVGLDRDPELLAALSERGEGLPVATLAAEGRDFALAEPVDLALAPMQFMQMLADEGERSACLGCVAAALHPGGTFAAAIVERMPAAVVGEPLLPDVREVEGWVYSSLPIEVAVGGDALVLRRLRQTVSPGGELSEEPNEVRIRTFAAERLEAEGAAAGLRPAGRHEIPPTEAHVGSTVVVMEKSA